MLALYGYGALELQTTIGLLRNFNTQKQTTLEAVREASDRFRERLAILSAKTNNANVAVGKIVIHLSLFASLTIIARARFRMSIWVRCEQQNQIDLLRRIRVSSFRRRKLRGLEFFLYDLIKHTAKATAESDE